MRIGHSGMRRAMVWVSAAALAGSVLVGCTGQDPEAPSVSDEPIESLETPTMSNSPGDGTASDGTPNDSTEARPSTLLLDELSWVMELEEPESFGGAAAGRGGGSVQLFAGEEEVPADAEVVEGRLYCIPAGAAAAIEFNHEPDEVECLGTEEPVVLEADAAVVRDARMVKLVIDPEGSSEVTAWAAVFEAK